MTTALLKFGQNGGATGGDGEAFVYDTAVGSYVSIGNSAGGGTVSSWRIELLYAPPGSPIEQAVGGPQPGVPQVLAENSNDSTPAYDITPDSGYYGCYRIRLTVWSGTGYTGLVDVDIRNIGVPTPNSKYIIPPYQDLPEPLPILGSGEPGEKPDEMNFEGQVYGWDGDDGSVTHKQLSAALLHLDGLSGAVPPTTPAQDDQLCFANGGVQDYAAGVKVLDVGGAEDGLSLTDLKASGTYLNIEGDAVWIYASNDGNIFIDDGHGFIFMEAGEIWIGDAPIIFQDWGDATIYHDADTASGASGKDFVIHAQDTTGGSGNTGGDLVVRGGNATGSAPGERGAFIVQTGAGTELARFDDVGSSPRVLLAADLLWASTRVPLIGQVDDTATDASGDTFTIAAQDCPNGSSSYGGDMVLQTGFGNHVFGAGELTVKLGGASGLNALVVRKNQIVITPDGQQQYLQLGGSTTVAETFQIQGQYQGSSSTTGGGDIVVIGGNSAAIRGGNAYLVGGIGTTTADGGDAFVLGGELDSGTGAPGSVYIGIADTPTPLIALKITTATSTSWSAASGGEVLTYNASGYVEWVSGGASKPSGAGDAYKVAFANAGGTDLDYADGVKISSGQTGIEFGTASIAGVSSNLEHNVATGQAHIFKVNNVEVARLDDTSSPHLGFGTCSSDHNTSLINYVLASTTYDVVVVSNSEGDTTLKVGDTDTFATWLIGNVAEMRGTNSAVIRSTSGVISFHANTSMYQEVGTGSAWSVQEGSSEILLQADRAGPGSTSRLALGRFGYAREFHIEMVQGPTNADSADLYITGQTSVGSFTSDGGSIIISSGAGAGTTPGDHGSVDVNTGPVACASFRHDGTLPYLILPTAYLAMGSDVPTSGDIRVGGSFSLVGLDSAEDNAVLLNWASNILTLGEQSNVSSVVFQAASYTKTFTFKTLANDSVYIDRSGSAGGPTRLMFAKTWDATIKLEDLTAAAGGGHTLSILGQDGYGTSEAGGNIDIGSGAPGPGGATGVINLKAGSTTILSISSFQMLLRETPAPSSTPASGYAHLWIDSTEKKLKVWFDNDTIVDIAQA